MKKTAFVFAVALMFCVCAAGQQSGDRRIKPQHGEYTIVVPDGWTYHDAGRAQVIATSVSNDITPNLVIGFDKTNLSLKDYVVKGFKNYIKIVSELNSRILNVSGVSEFITDSGQKGIKLVLGIQVFDRVISQNIYLFDGANGKKWAIGATVAVKDYSSYDRDFDRIVRTWKLNENKKATKKTEKKK